MCLQKGGSCSQSDGHGKDRIKNNVAVRSIRSAFKDCDMQVTQDEITCFRIS